jgi:hypothetical protein
MFKYKSNDVGVTASGCDGLDHDIGVETLTEARTLVLADSGKTFLLSLAGGFAVTLPAPIRGFRAKFITGVIPTTAYTITATGAIVHGGINELEVDTGDDGPIASGSTTLTLVASALGTVGDWVEYLGDGARWLITGQTKLDGAVTFS